MKKYAPALLTLLAFFLTQGLGSVVLLVVNSLSTSSLDLFLDGGLDKEAAAMQAFQTVHTSAFSVIMMVVNLLTVIVCYVTMHNIQIENTFNVAAVNWRVGLVGLVGGILGSMGIGILTDGMEYPDVMQQTSLAMAHNAWGLLALVIVGPITEELLFREAMLGEMVRRGANPWAAIVISAVAFGAVHINLAQGLYAIPMGILMGIIYYRSGNIVLSAILHMINNLVVAVQMNVLGADAVNVSYEEWLGGPLPTYAVLALSVLCCIVLCKIFWDRYTPVGLRNGNSLF